MVEFARDESFLAEANKCEFKLERMRVIKFILMDFVLDKVCAMLVFRSSIISSSNEKTARDGFFKNEEL